MGIANKLIRKWKLLTQPSFSLQCLNKLVHPVLASLPTATKKNQSPKVLEDSRKEKKKEEEEKNWGGAKTNYYI